MHEPLLLLSSSGHVTSVLVPRPVTCCSAEELCSVTAPADEQQQHQRRQSAYCAVITHTHTPNIDRGTSSAAVRRLRVVWTHPERRNACLVRLRRRQWWRQCSDHLMIITPHQCVCVCVTHHTLLPHWCYANHGSMIPPESVSHYAKIII